MLWTLHNILFQTWWTWLVLAIAILYFIQCLKSGRWRPCYNPDLMFIISRMAIRCSKIVRELVPHFQIRPTNWPTNECCCQPTNPTVPLMVQHQKSKLTKLRTPTRCSHWKYSVDSRTLLPVRTCCTTPRGCLTPESVEVYGHYIHKYESYLFAEDTIASGEELMHTVWEERHVLSWQSLIE